MFCREEVIDAAVAYCKNAMNCNTRNEKEDGMDAKIGDN